MTEEHPHSTIEAEEAVMYWTANYDGKKDRGRFYIGLPEHQGGHPPFEYTSDFGAHDLKWKDRYSEAQRVQTILEYALEAIVVHRCDPAEVIREVCKVRQVYDHAEGSLPLRRTFSTALIGSAWEDWPPKSGDV